MEKAVYCKGRIFALCGKGDTDRLLASQAVPWTGNMSEMARRQLPVFSKIKRTFVLIFGDTNYKNNNDSRRKAILIPQLTSRRCLERKTRVWALKAAETRRRRSKWISMEPSILMMLNGINMEPSILMLSGIRMDQYGAKHIDA